MLILGNMIGSGAQGDVYKIEHKPGLCAKVYKKGMVFWPISRELYDKFIHLMPNFPERELRLYQEFENILPLDLRQNVVNIHGIEEVQLGNKVVNALIMNLITDSEGKIAKTFIKHVENGGSVSLECLSIILRLMNSINIINGEVLDFHLGNVLISDGNPMLVDFLSHNRLAWWKSGKSAQYFEKRMNAIKSKVFEELKRLSELNPEFGDIYKNAINI